MLKRIVDLLLRALIVVPLPLAAISAGPVAQQRGALGADSCQIALVALDSYISQCDEIVRKAGALTRVGTSSEADSLKTLIAQYSATLAALKLELGDRTTAPSRLGCVQIRALSVRGYSLLSDMRREEARIRMYVMEVRRATQMVRRTDAALYRANALVRKADVDPEAFKGLRKAFELQEEAKARLSARNLEAALRLTMQARMLVGEAASAALDSLDMVELKHEARQFYEKTGSLISEARVCAVESGDPRAGKLIAMAQAQQDKAREAVDAKQPYRAIRHARAARKIVTEASRLCRRGQAGENRLERAQENLQQAREAVDESENGDAKRILAKGEERLAAARRLWESGRKEQARAEFDIAAKLIGKAVDVARSGEGAGSTGLGLELRRTTAIVAKARSVATTDVQKEQVNRAQALVEKARTCTGDQRVCMGLLDEATDLAIEVISQRHSSAGQNAETDTIDVK